MFTHLHWHSHYSLLEWLWKPASIIEKAKSLEMTNIAITDYWAMFGAIEFYKLSKKAWINAIIWVDILFVPNILKKDPNEKINYITLIAKNFEWYENLLQITSIANLKWSNPKPRIDLENIEKYSNWLIWFMWWENSLIWQMILANEPEKKIIELIWIFKTIFNNNFYLEIIAQNHSENPNLRLINNNLFDLSQKSDTKLIVNNNFHYINKQDKQALDVAWCIKDWLLFYDQNRKKIIWDYHIFSEEEIRNTLISNWYNEQTINELINNNNSIAQEINLNIPLGEILFPIYESPQNIKELFEKNINKTVE